MTSPAAAQGDPVGGTGNHYSLAGAGNFTGKAGVDFVYGDPGDEFYFGDFVDAAGRFGGDGRDDAMVRRGNHFFVHNDNSTGVADHDFTFGNPDDVVLVGDWAQQSWSTGEITTSSDGADQIVVRRGNTYIESQDFRWTPSGIPVFAGRSYMYWDVTDTAFTARLEWLDVPKGGYNTYTGDGLAVRR